MVNLGGLHWLHPLKALNFFKLLAFSKVGIDPMIDGAFIGFPPGGAAVREEKTNIPQMS